MPAPDDANLGVASPPANEVEQHAAEQGDLSSDANTGVQPGLLDDGVGQEPLDLDVRVALPAQHEIQPLPHDSKVDLGNVFGDNGKTRTVNVKGEVFLTEKLGENGKPKTAIDGGQVTVEKPIR